MSNNYSQFGSNDWLKMQQHLMDTWLKALGQSSQNRSAHITGDTVVDGMTQWWKTVSSSMPEGNQEFLQKLMEQARIYYVLGEQFTGLLKIFHESSKATTDWQQALEEKINELKNLFTNTQNSTSDALHSVFGAWQQLPMDTLQRTLASASFMPGDFMHDMKPEVLETVTDKFLSIPGVGYTREHQERIQEGMRLWNDYQKVAQEYNTEMNRIAISALDAMRKKIIYMAGNGEDITSLRQIYDIWVDCNEEAYADYAYSDDFSKLYGKLTNALMAVKHHGRLTVDEVLSALGMPNHRTMNTLQKRQQDIRREQKRDQLTIEKIQKEVSELKKQQSGTVENKEEKKSGKRFLKKKKTGKKAAARKKVDKKAKKKGVRSKKATKKKTVVKGKPEKIIIKI